MKMWARAIAVWLLVMAVEFVHGNVAMDFPAATCGCFRSGQIGIFTGSMLFLLVVYFCKTWMKLRGATHCLRVGALLRGGLMPVGLAIFGMTPWVAWRLRRSDGANGGLDAQAKVGATSYGT